MYQIKTEEELGALVSPARQEIVDAVVAIGPCTVAQMSEVMGRPADALYYHVRRLISVGLLRETGTRRSGSRDEAIYDLRGRPMRVAYDLGNRRMTNRLVRAVTAMLRLADRDFRAAVRSKDTKGGGPDRNIWGGRCKAWLTRQQVREVRKHLEAINEITQGASRSPGARLHAVTWVLTPLTPNLRATRSKEK